MKKLLLVVGLMSATSLSASPGISFPDYVQNLKQEAKTQGISAATVDASFVDVRFIERAVKNDRNQPEFKLTLDSYLPKAVPEWKVRQAQQLYRKHYALLQQIGVQYGVQPRFIVALWGIETNFGKLTGKYSLVSALSTLAYEGRREAFFKKELFAALRIIEQGHATPQTLKGSWAGAMGQVQFMPSSFLAYAVDQDGDGRKDLWHSQADVFASAAYYLQQHGWKGEENWARRVRAPQTLDPALVGLTVSKPVSEWRALGVVNLDGSSLPAVVQQASLVMPDDKEGRAYLAYDNYKALMGWNRSNYFVVAVGYLADRIVGEIMTQLAENERFWEHKSLEQMSQSEWESLCDGCGKCCLVKLEDADSGELIFTNVACDLLNLKTCQCGDYPNRFKKMPDCLQLTLDKIPEFHWLPTTCAYRLLAEGDPLPVWHPLLTGSRSAMHAAGHSIRNKVIHERFAGEWEDHIVTWPLGF